MFVRFSTSLGARGSDDLVRDPRGFGMKFFTKEGVYDILNLNTPIFFINDPIFLPELVNTGRKDPATNLINQDTRFKFFAEHPETTSMLTMI